MLLGHFADQNRRSDFLFHQRAKRIKAETFVLAASDEDDRFALRAQRFVHRVEVCRLRVVHIFDTADFAHKFATVRPRLIAHRAAGPFPRTTSPRAMPAASVAIRFSMLCSPRSLVSDKRRTAWF